MWTKVLNATSSRDVEKITCFYNSRFALGRSYFSQSLPFMRVHMSFSFPFNFSIWHEIELKRRLLKNSFIKDHTLEISDLKIKVNSTQVGSRPLLLRDERRRQPPSSLLPHNYFFDYVILPIEYRMMSWFLLFTHILLNLKDMVLLS